MIRGFPGSVFGARDVGASRTPEEQRRHEEDKARTIGAVAGVALIAFAIGVFAAEKKGRERGWL